LGTGRTARCRRAPRHEAIDASVPDAKAGYYETLISFQAGLKARLYAQRFTVRSMKSTSSRDTLVSGVPTDSSCDE
jgi:hypothetical protein